MKVNAEANASAGGHGVQHEGHSDHGSAHGTLRGYITGFVLAAILTAIPFWLVMGDVFEDKMVTATLVILCGAVQIVVHMVYFLHMNANSESGWTIMALLFTIVIIFIAVSGSLWIMFHLNTNMMPMTPEMMKNMP